MTTDGHRLGIDFGTSNTVAVLADPDGRVRPLLFDGSPLLPSAVFAGAGPGLLVGADAMRAAVGAPAGLEANPKRRIDDGTVWLADREHRIEALIAAVLARVAEEAARVAGDVPRDVVLTHPAAWQRPRLGILGAAAQRAGLDRVRFVAEPVAAAAYFAAVLGRRIRRGGSIVVYDLGAGTFDVSVVRPSATGFEVVASDGLADVGGLDLDALVIRHVRSLTRDATDAWQRLDWPQEPADQLARQGLWSAARGVKELLSRHPQGDLHLPLVDRRVHLTRAEFETAAREHLDRTAELTRSVLRTAAVPPEDVAAVFLVGGSSRIPLAATLLHRTLRIAPTVLDQPELVVAEGSLHVPTAAEPPAAPSLPPVGAPAASPPVGAPPASPPAEVRPVSPPADVRPASPPAEVPPAFPPVDAFVASASVDAPSASPPVEAPVLAPPAAGPVVPPPVRRAAPVRARVLIGLGLFVYLAGLVGVVIVRLAPDFREGDDFAGIEEVAGIVVFQIVPACAVLGAGLNTRLRASSRSRWYALLIPSALLAAVPLGWVAYWSDGGQAYVLPFPFGLGVIGVLVATVGLLRRRRVDVARQ